jgi:hypothetical protein
MVAVRLCDVQPDGASTRITYGVFNLCHRHGHEFPAPVTPGETMEIAVRLDDIAYNVAPGHRLRLAISSAYWPLVWPSPEPVALTLQHGSLDLPVRASGSGDEATFAEPEGATSRQVETLRESSNSRVVEQDQTTGTVTLAIVDDFGEVRELNHGLETGGVARERWTIEPADPLSAYGETHWTQTLSRSGWSVRTETRTTMRSDRENFHLTGRIEAFEGDQLVFERDFDETIERDHI